MTPELQAGYSWELSTFITKVTEVGEYHIGYEIADHQRVVVTGFVKWDHCSNWNFVGPYHGCNEEMLLNLGKVLSACWRHTEKFLPSWDR